MSVTHVVGVDPGLVHTGAVSVFFIPANKTISIRHEVVNGPDSVALMHFWNTECAGVADRRHVFIEGYRPRSHFRQDKRMVEAVSEMHKALPGSKVLNNTGIKKVVHRPTLELLGLWNFGTPTHHDDLRSAARILVLGMLKDKDMNCLLSDIVLDHLGGNTWHVEHV